MFKVIVWVWSVVCEVLAHLRGWCLMIKWAMEEDDEDRINRLDKLECERLQAEKLNN